MTHAYHSHDAPASDQPFELVHACQEQALRHMKLIVDVQLPPSNVQSPSPEVLVRDKRYTATVPALADLEH